jgi:hypothetical protein
METESLQGGRMPSTAIETIVAVHTAFNARRLDELEVLVHEDLDLFLPLALGLTPDAERGIPALRRTLENVLRVAPDLWLELERAETVGDLTIIVCNASATGTDDVRYTWPLRVLVAADQGRITRYVVRAPHADLLADKAAFRR